MHLFPVYKIGLDHRKAIDGGNLAISPMNAGRTSSEKRGERSEFVGFFHLLFFPF